jgi:hypothetical protein
MSGKLADVTRQYYSNPLNECNRDIYVNWGATSRPTGRIFSYVKYCNAEAT